MFGILLGGCSPSSDDTDKSPDPISQTDTSSLKLELSLQAARTAGHNITQVVAVLTKGDFNQQVTLEIDANDLATATINDLAIGQYEIALQVFDGTTLIDEGEGTANIIKDEIASANVDFDVFKGELTLTITLEGEAEVPNTLPIANAGPDQSVGINNQVTLNGSTSADTDSDNALTYSWSQTAGTTVTLENVTSAQPTFTAPSNTDTLTFTLTVNDGELDSNTSSVNINVINQQPVADAGADQTVGIKSQVTLNGTNSSDTDSEIELTYSWSQTAGTTVTLSNSNTSQPIFTAPDSTDTLTFTLTVNDGELDSISSSVNIN